MALADKHTHQAMRVVAETALREWALDVAAMELVSVSENTVFKVSTRSGEALVLRVHRPGYHRLAELISEQRWTAALLEAGVSVPVPRHTSDGRGYVSVPVPGTDEQRYVGLVEWVDGETVHQAIEHNADVASLTFRFEQLGRLAARIHNASVAWAIPNDFQRHALDADGLMGNQPFWGLFWVLPQLSLSQRELILTARDAIYRMLSDYGKNHGTYSLIHADLHPRNLLINGDQLHVIDFDDAGFGWHQYELAVALFSYRDHPHTEMIQDALIRGYRSARDLDDAAVSLIPMFILIRALALLGSIHERPELDHHSDLPDLIALACHHANALGLV
ncbi:aminoglycoside phosphotransferase [Candidatus Entotheonella serta]|nr:aminoglycoside phosphotransferase [Candidatus Entotheonella serta]